MARNKVEVDLTLRDKLSAPMRKATSSVSGMTDRLSKLGKMAGLVAGVGGGLGLVAGLTAFAKSSISAAREVEDLEVRLISLKGSQAAATKSMEAYQAVAAKVPFSLQQVAQAGTTLEAMTGQGEALLPILTDVAAVMGLDLPTAASALGRAFSSGAGAADVFRERGILNIVKDFAKIDDITKLSLPEFQKAMIGAFTDEGGKIAGASKRLSETLTGQLSMVSDSVFKLTSTFGKALLPAIKDLVTNQISPLVKGWAEWIKLNEDLIKTKADEWFKKVADNAKSAATHIKDVFTAIKPILNTVIEGWALLPSPVRELGLITALLLGPKGVAIAAAVTLAAGGIQKIITLSKESAQSHKEHTQSLEFLGTKMAMIEKRARSLESRGFSRLAETVRAEALPAINEVVKGFGDAAIYVEDFSELINHSFEKIKSPTIAGPKIGGPSGVGFAKEGAKAAKVFGDAWEYTAGNIIDDFDAMTRAEELTLDVTKKTTRAFSDAWEKTADDVQDSFYDMTRADKAFTIDLKRNMTVSESAVAGFTRGFKGQLGILKDGTYSFAKATEQTFDRVGQAFQSGFSDAIFNTITGRFNSLKDVGLSVADAIARAFADLAASALANNIGSLLNTVTQGLTAVGGWVNNLFLAEGGIVTKPTRAIIGEAGPEAVIPLKAGSRFLASYLKSSDLINELTLSVAKALFPDAVAAATSAALTAQLNALAVSSGADLAATGPAGAPALTASQINSQLFSAIGGGIQAASLGLAADALVRLLLGFGGREGAQAASAFAPIAGATTSAISAAALGLGASIPAIGAAVYLATTLLAGPDRDPDYGLPGVLSNKISDVALAQAQGILDLFGTLGVPLVGIRQDEGALYGLFKDSIFNQALAGIMNPGSIDLDRSFVGQMLQLFQGGPMPSALVNFKFLATDLLDFATVLRSQIGQGGVLFDLFEFGTLQQRPGFDAYRQPSAFAAAKGFSGMVSSPTLFLAGESGIEQVDISPTRGGRRGGIRGMTININFNAPVTIRDERDAELLSRELARRIEREQTAFG